MYWELSCSVCHIICFSYNISRYDRTLGGVAFQMRLRDHLAKVFNNQKKTKSDVTKNPRAMAKLFKEVGRVKRVLSANSEHFAQVRKLYLKLISCW